MRKLIPIVILLLCLSSCHISDVVNTDAFSSDEPTVALTPSPTPTVMPQPLHSPLYIDGVSIEEVIGYFNEVCLDAEFVNAGDPHKLQKWNSPIYYYIFGDPTEQDRKVLTNFCDWLNDLYGFPGIYESESQYDANLKIHFCDYDTMVYLLGENFHGMDAGVTFWYDYDVIYDETICIRTDLSQNLRNSVILEELYNGLGPVQDTALRPDSIIYSDYSEPQELSQIDMLLLELLYHPDMKCGMDGAECEEIIRQLYY